jgi:hypothetical protein
MSKAQERFPHLLEPEMLPAQRLQRLVGESLRDRLNDRAAAVAAANVGELATLVVLQEPQRHRLPGEPLERVLQTARNIRQQEFSAPIYITAVMNQHRFDPHPKQQAEMRDLGVTPLPIEANTVNTTTFNAATVFMRGGLAARDRDQFEVVVPIVAGNRFATDQALRAASQHVGGDTHAAFGPLLNGAKNPSTTARWALNGGGAFYDSYAEPVVEYPSKESYGYMSSAGCVLGATVLRETGIDTSLERDVAFRDFAVKNQCYGESGPKQPVIYDNALAIHDARSITLGRDDLIAEADLFGPQA